MSDRHNDLVPTVLRPRWFLFLLAWVPPLLWCTHGLLSHAWPEFAFGLFLAYGVVRYVRRPTITVTDDGLWIRRSLFNQLFSSWAEVVGVERRQFGPFATDQLRLRETLRKYVTADMKSPAQIMWKPRPNQHVLIGLYDKHWRTGPIGAALAARGVSLEATAPLESANPLPE